MMKKILCFTAAVLTSIGVAGCGPQSVTPEYQLGITSDASWYIDQLGDDAVIYDVTKHVYGENYEDYVDAENNPLYLTIVVQCERDENGKVKFGISRGGIPLPYDDKELNSEEFRRASSKWVPNCTPLLENKNNK